MVSMLEDVIDRGTGTRGAAVGRSRADRRQDRHHQRLQGRLVRRLLVVARRRRLGRVRSAADDRRATPTAPSTRCRSGATSCGRRCARGRRGEFEVPAGAARRAAVPRLVPAAGRRLPDLHRVLQGRRSGAGPPVPDPPGQRQAARPPGGRRVPLRARQADRRDLLALTVPDAAGVFRSRATGDRQPNFLRSC